MDRPTININGQEIILPEVKARVWREIMQFESVRKDIKSVDAIDKYCAVIAMAFGVTADEVLDNLDIADVLPTYFATLNCVVAMLTEKLSKKKAEEPPQP